MPYSLDQASPEVIKLFSCSAQLSTIFQLLIKTEIPTNKKVSCFKSLRCCIMLINVKMPTIDGILTFMSRINFVLSCVEHENFITSGPGLGPNCLQRYYQTIQADKELYLRPGNYNWPKSMV